MRLLDHTHRPLQLAAACAAILALLVLSGCGTAQPRKVDANELAEAQTFPYFRVYWAGHSFLGNTLSAVDGQKGYLSSIGDSIYYGDCVHNKGLLGGGSCVLPLQVTTVIYRLHSNTTLGKQRNVVVRGVPATVYDEGRSIELYSGRVAIDVFSNSYAHAYAAVEALYPLNAPGTAAGNLPAPIFCPGLSGPQSASVKHVMNALPAHACQRAGAALAFARSIYPS
ncbi:MAG TPA: hypothetical protein VK761_08105 [Solirubrobacteraceae bacterium]|nr:hypothetical protein [Solirubrobacteraceae bacterium]